MFTNINSDRLYHFGIATITMTCIYGLIGLIGGSKIISLVSKINDAYSMYSDSSSMGGGMINFAIIFIIAFTVVLGLTAGFGAIVLSQIIDQNNGNKKVRNTNFNVTNSNNSDNYTNNSNNYYDDLDI